MKNSLVAAGALAAVLASGNAASAEDLVFTLKNASNSTLERFYTSPVGTNDWEDDVFGNDTLGPGESMTITIADGRAVCEYDMRFEFTADSDLEDMEDSQDLCAMGSYTVSE